MIREITQEDEKDQYIALNKYCFPNMNNWIDNLFPLPQDDIVWGKFFDKSLQAGLISKSFLTFLFGERVKMSGISAVVSAPEKRNSGHVRELMTHALQKDIERGMLISSLTPFQFRYYEKMGYGYIGGPVSYGFNPEHILPLRINGEFIPVESAEHTRELAKVHDQFVSHYDFGIESQFDINNYHNNLKAYNSYAYIYRYDNEPSGYIEYQLLPGEGFPKKMQILRMAFLDTGSFQALFAFIRSHRNNCSDVTMSVPANLELRQLFQEPRIKIETISNWMARPLNVEAVLRLRLANDPCAHDIEFSVNDPLISKNTGTYKLHNTEVTKTGHSEQNPIPFAVFSSLLFGAVTFSEAYLSGRIEWYDEATAGYFSKKQNIYLSATF